MRDEKGRFTKGHKKPKKMLEKISESLKITFKNKENHPWFGKHFSMESREKMSESHVGIQAGRNHPMYGKKHSMKVRKKISEALMGHIPWNKGLRGVMKSWNKGTKGVCKPNSGSFISGERQRKIAILANKKQAEMKEPTSIEKKVYEELKSRGLLFETQKLINGKFLVDAYIPSLNLIIEADGDYWHSLDRVKKRDRAKNAYLTKCGFNLLRLTESEINSGDFINKFDSVSNLDFGWKAIVL